MARVSISWDGGEAVEYEGGQEAMQYLAASLYFLLGEGLVIASKGAGDLQYETGVQEDNSHSVYLGRFNDQGDQLDLEDAIKEVNDNGC